LQGFWGERQTFGIIGGVSFLAAVKLRYPVWVGKNEKRSFKADSLWVKFRRKSR